MKCDEARGWVTRRAMYNMNIDNMMDVLVIFSIELLPGKELMQH